MNASGDLLFSSSPGLLWFSAAFVLLVAVLGFLGWQRSGFRGSIGALEALRVLLAAAIALTLHRPEWRQTYDPEKVPVVAVLHDVSGSMETRDVLQEGSPPLSRAEAAAPLSEAPLWDPLRERWKVIIAPFASRDEPLAEGTDLNAALMAVLEEQPDLRTVVLVSDGDWNEGQAPIQAATQMRMREIPVFALPLGSDTRLPDLNLTSFDVPTFAVAGKPLRIPFTIESSLPRDEVVNLGMTTSLGETETLTVTVPAMGRLEEALTWLPREIGDVHLTLTVDPSALESLTENNRAEADLEIRQEQLRVLVIESLPRWEYRYLRNALERDPGVEVNTLLYHPDLGKRGAGRGYLPAFPPDDVLARMDVVFLGDVGLNPDMLTSEQCESLVKLVRDQAGGLVFLPGPRGHMQTLQGTALGELFPVIWDAAQPRGWGTGTPGRFAITEAGRASLLTKLDDDEDAGARVWNTLPGFSWYGPALRAKAGSEVLATHASESNTFGRIPLIVTRTYGAGKILYMGADGAWRWRRGVEDRYHYRFWGQVCRWMAYQRNMAQGENMRLFFSPDRPRTGATLTLNANVMDITGEPLREGTVVAQIVSPGGRPASIRLTPAGEDAWGLFTGTFTPTEPGNHAVQLTAAAAGSSLETNISVQGSGRESRGVPARPEVLKEIAQITRGEVLSQVDPADVVTRLAALPQDELLERRLQIWAHPLWAGLLILLLTVFWTGRKMAGVF